MNKRTHADIEIIWDYLRRGEDRLELADAILLFCSYDIRVADFAAKLYLDGYAPTIIVSGGVAPRSKLLAGGSEAETFGQRLLSKGIPSAAILLENKSTNTGENVLFTYRLIERELPSLESIIIVQKPYMTRRAYAAFMKQWPGQPVKVQTASIDQTFDEYSDGSMSEDKIINSMVGDLQRIKEYPKSGLQIEQDIPDNVWAAWRRLVEAGYNKRLL